jgi:hypothetical protein
MPEYHDITQSVISKSCLPVVLEKFRAKALSYSLIRDAILQFEAIEGARASGDQFLFRTRGDLAASLTGLPSLNLKFSADGEYSRTKGRVFLTNFKVLNDLGGMANKLVEVTGIGVGRSLHVSPEDDELLRTLLPEPN